MGRQVDSGEDAAKRRSLQVSQAKGQGKRKACRRIPGGGDGVRQKKFASCLRIGYVDAVGLPTMAINASHNSLIGPGGSTRRLHHPHPFTGAKQDRREGKSLVFARYGIRRIGPP